MIVNKSSTIPKYLLGFHGCLKSTGTKIKVGSDFIHSQNKYDWLGHGIYFWENNLSRAIDWAKQSSKKESNIFKRWLDRYPNMLSKDAEQHAKDYFEPCVLGVVVDMIGNWIDLMDANHTQHLQKIAKDYIQSKQQLGQSIPNNKGVSRELDCDIVNHFVQEIQKQHNIVVDGVRGAFVEGDELYQSAGFYQKTHIQLSVRNKDRIIEVFEMDYINLSNTIL
jgi:hypothetical protein